MTEATKIHVFYTNNHFGWCAMHLDADDFQVGDSDYHYRKADAVAWAKITMLPVHIYGRNGLHQRTVQAKPRT